MRIALLTDGIWSYAIGGIQRHFYFLCKFLAINGVKVDLYCTLKDKKLPENFDEVFLPEELINIRIHLVDYPNSVYFPGHYIWQSYKYSKNLFSVFQPYYTEYDIVYIQGFCGWYFFKIRNKFNYKIPGVLNMHGLEMFQIAPSIKGGLKQLMFRPFAKLQLLKADYIQSLGGKLSDILLSLRINPAKIFTCGIAVDEKWLRASIPSMNVGRTFTFIGRYEERKGIEVLISALNLLIEDELDFQFNFIGPIPRHLQISHRKIKYFGSVTDTELVMSVLDASHFIVLPSYSEGMPTVLLEGMARGCAVIASDVGAVSEMVSDRNGFLVPPGDTQSLYQALSNGITMASESLQDLRIKSHQIVLENFLWENLINKMISDFQRFTMSKEGGQFV